MLIAKIKHTETGNSVANYTEEVHRCDVCKGEGWEIVSKEEVMEIMENTTFDHGMKVFKQWKFNDGRIDCAECAGQGEFTIRK